MIKIFLTVRNRLAITKKCIHALKVHSELPHQIYVYNNNTNYLLEEHFAYFMKAYEKRVIHQITFTTPETTFNAFSKAATCNFFGKQHNEDPNKDKYSFLVMLDNDIIVTPGWDQIIRSAWKYVNKNKLTDVKVIGQQPGGIKGLVKVDHKITDNITARIGKLGGSGLWSVRSNFFTDVGFLDLKQLVGQDKKHDQLYWRLMEQTTKGRPYIMGVKAKLGIHCGSEAGSVCNVLTRGRNKAGQVLNDIKFPEAEKTIDSYDFDKFYEKISKSERMLNDW